MGTWPRSMPCTGPQIPSERDAANLLGAGQRMGMKGKKALMRRELLTQSCSSLTDFWSVPHKMGN